MRVVPKERILGLVPDDATRVGLVGAAVSDHPKVVEIVRELAGISGEDPPAEASRRLTQLVPDGDDASLVCERVGGVIGLGDGARSEEAFWALVDSIYADQGRVDDPHLWERAKALGLDVERFDRDRRSTAPAERVRRDFQGGIRAGVASTPAAFLDGAPVAVDLASGLAL